MSDPARAEALQHRVYAWLGGARDRMPADLVRSLQDVLGELALQGNTPAAPDPIKAEKLPFDDWWARHKNDEPCWRLKQEEAAIIWFAAQKAPTKEQSTS